MGRDCVEPFIRHPYAVHDLVLDPRPAVFTLKPAGCISAGLSAVQVAMLTTFRFEFGPLEGSLDPEYWRAPGEGGTGGTCSSTILK